MRFLLFLSVLAPALAAMTHEVEYSSMHAAAKGWTMGERANGQATIKLVVAVKQSNVDVLQAKLMDISNPLSPNYSQHMSKKEVENLMAPRLDDVMTAIAFLKGGNESRVVTLETPNGEFISSRVTVSEAESLLEAQYYVFTHSNTGRNAVRLATGYTVPKHIVSAVDFIAPTTRFPPSTRLAISTHGTNKKHLRQDVGDASGSNTPQILWGLYQTTGVVHDPNAAGNQIGFTNFLNEHYSNTDAATFWKKYNVQPTAITDNPANQTKGTGVEAELDCQYLTAMGQGIPTISYSNDGAQPGNPENEPFLEWLINVSNDDNPPFVYSVSYGEQETTVNYDYATRCNVEFQKAGVRGISILIASGDDGAGGNCTGANPRLTPEYPTSSPYVTSVGGTVGGKIGAEPTGETVDSISGGGFSDYWQEIPDWQKDDVAAYINNCKANNCPALTSWNQNGRAYPDIAAQSEGFAVVRSNQVISVAGTSAATPTASGIIGLLNDARLAAGKTSLGFLNPFLYYAATVDTLAFNDVVKGRNLGCAGGGFSAASGWDPATGLGTLNYKRLVKIALALP